MINVVSTNSNESSISRSGGIAGSKNGYDNTPEYDTSTTDRYLLLGNDTDIEDEEYDEIDDIPIATTPTRVLLGIFTTLNDVEQRNIYRKLLQSFYPRICSLYDFENTIVPALQSESSTVVSSSLLSRYLFKRQPKHDVDNDHNNSTMDCTLIYTFVLGMDDSTRSGNDNENIEELPTEITSNRARMDLEAQPPTTTGSESSSNDWYEKDMTFLPIR